MTEANFHAGHIISERYEVLSLLGRGGMGSVYRVRQIYLNQEFALKTINKESISSTAIMRFQQEARTAYSLDHPSIIAVNDSGVLKDDTPFLVMEVLNGETLGDRIKRAGALKLDDALPIFIQVCFGLAYAHDAGVVHRDIKPGNIMLLSGKPSGSEGSVKIVDFGIAKLIAHDDGEIQALTRTGEIFGSPLYMSPEQCNGAKIDHRSDIYSLGCVFFEALTGAAPFVGENALSTMMKHQNEQPPTLKDASLGVVFPQWLEQLIATMLAKNPDQRYKSLGEVAIELGARGDASGVVRGSKMSAKNAAPVSISREKLFGLFALSAVGLVCATVAVCYHFMPSKNNLVPSTSAQTIAPTIAVDRPIIEVAPFIEDTKVENSKAMMETALRNAAKKHGILTLKFGEFTPENLDQICQSPGITAIDFESAVLPNASLDKLTKLRLTSINLVSSTFDDDGAAALSKCFIEAVYTDGTQITNEGVRSLATMRNLKILKLGGSYINDETCAILSKASSLEDLQLKNSKGLSKAAFNSLSELKNLHRLSLIEDLLANETYLALANIKTLQVLTFHQFLSLPILYGLCEKLRMNCPEFKKIEFRDCPTVKSGDIEILRHRFPEFEFAVDITAVKTF